jgi:ketosteroid isomerase-like protein
MKRFISIGLVLLAASVAFAQPPAKKSAASADEQAIAKLEQEWGDALVKRDFTVINRIAAPEWMLTTPDGNISTKAKADEDLKAGTIVFTSFKLDDIKVNVFGNTAVAFGLETEKSTYKGNDISGQYRFTDTFVKRDGKWQCVATHVSKVEKK